MPIKRRQITISAAGAARNSGGANPNIPMPEAHRAELLEVAGDEGACGYVRALLVAAAEATPEGARAAARSDGYAAVGTRLSREEVAVVNRALAVLDLHFSIWARLLVVPSARAVLRAHLDAAERVAAREAEDGGVGDED